MISTVEETTGTFEYYIRRGNESESIKDWPQAAYWFFQAEAGTEGDNFKRAFEEVEKLSDWGDEFDKFLGTFWERGDLESDTEWDKVKRLWTVRNRIKQLYENSLTSFSALHNIELGCCIIWGTNPNNDNDNTVSSGTGFLTKYKGLKFIMTNHHVLQHAEEKQYIAQFPDATGSEQEPVFTMISKNFAGNKDLDVGLCTFHNPTLDKRPHFDLEQLGDVRDSDAVIIYQHPKGKELHASIGSIDKREGDEVSYTASTESGSSGSFVLGPDLKPIALHKMSVNTETKFGVMVTNRGTKFKTVRDWIDHNFTEIADILGQNKVDETGVTGFERRVEGHLAKLMKEIKEMRQAICQIINTTTKGTATGFLAVYKGNRFIVTSSNVLANGSSGCHAHFDYRDEESSGFQVKITDELRHCKGLNVSIVGYETNETDEKSEQNLTQRYHFDLGMEYLESKTTKPGDAIITFQRPGYLSEDKTLTTTTTTTTITTTSTTESSNDILTSFHQSIGNIKCPSGISDGTKIFYDASARDGSEGSPVLSAEWKLIAIHNDQTKTLLLNNGTLASAVSQWIEQNKINDTFLIGRRTYIDTDIETVLKKMFEKDVSLERIAEKLDKDIDVIKSFQKEWLKKNDLDQLDPDDTFLIKRLIDKSKGAQEIAKKLHKEPELIRTYMEKVHKEKLLGMLDEDDRFLIKRMVAKKRSAGDIAKKFGHSEESINIFIESDPESRKLCAVVVPGLDEIDQLIIDALYEESLTFTVRPVCEKFGLSRKSVDEYCQLTQKKPK